MSSKEKQHQKELRRPDPFQVKLANFLEYLLSHSKSIAAAVALIALLVGGFYIFESIQDGIRKGRVEELGKIHVVYFAEEKKAQDLRQEVQKKIDALSPPPPASTADGAEPKLPEPLSPEKEKQKSDLTNEMEKIKPDHTESAKQYEVFYKKYTDKPEGWAAALLVAKSAIDRQAFEEARKIYEELAQKTQSEPFYQIQVRLGLSGLYEEQGEFDKALGEVEHLLGLVGSGKETSTTKQSLYAAYAQELTPKLLLRKAQIQYFKGVKTEALQTLAQITEKHPASPEAQKARNMKFVVQ